MITKSTTGWRELEKNQKDHNEIYMSNWILEGIIVKPFQVLVKKKNHWLTAYDSST